MHDESYKRLLYSALGGPPFIALTLGIAGCTAQPTSTAQPASPAMLPSPQMTPAPVATRKRPEEAVAGRVAAAAPSAASAAQVDAPSAREAREIARLSLITRGSPMPALRAPLDDGSVLDTAALAGKEAYVVVFFTTWCPVCERKMPVIRRALRKHGQGMLSVAVALDDEETSDDVAAYLKRHRLPFRMVRGAAQTAVGEALDPKGSFPIVYVVGSDGLVVDVQLGLKPDHGTRLDQALRQARAPQQ